MKRFFFFLTLWLSLAFTGQAQEEITFCAYNVRNYLESPSLDADGSVKTRSKPEAEIQAVVRFLIEIQPDILGICEIGDVDDLKDLQSRLMDEGLTLPHLEIARGGDPTRSLGLLSRFPIVARQSQSELRYQIGAQELLMQRGILDVAVEVAPRQILRFLGIHLKSKRPVPEADEALMRRNEAHLLRQHVEQILAADPQTKLLIYGDFNAHANEAALLEIEGSQGKPTALTDIRVSDSRGETWTHFWAAADSYARLDYLLISKPLQPWVNTKASYIYDPVDFLAGSDHRPLVLKLKPGSRKKR